ncbi:unnamed protein product [Rangifer tarandus platyrhynchus]|uniref:Uncharacterized protein n=1 Tax=Rangifer tarandus platyrhynchus TaxID=3082113 RepID=A0ABN8ZTN8_RANTA|nr:unnamed protein product [Rangifer tarandus platyrhynchus]
MDWEGLGERPVGSRSDQGAGGREVILGGGVRGCSGVQRRSGCFCERVLEKRATRGPHAPPGAGLTQGPAVLRCGLRGLHTDLELGLQLGAERGALGIPAPGYTLVAAAPSFAFLQ